jgi:hypothetical protein
MTQALYAHMNNKKIKIKKYIFPCWSLNGTRRFPSEGEKFQLLLSFQFSGHRAELPLTLPYLPSFSCGLFSPASSLCSCSPPGWHLGEIPVKGPFVSSHPFWSHPCGLGHWPFNFKPRTLKKARRADTVLMQHGAQSKDWATFRDALAWVDETYLL